MYLLLGKSQRNVARGNPQRESLGNRRLAHAGFADQTGVVLAAAGEDLHHAADLPVPADNRVYASFLRLFGQVFAVAVQKTALALVFAAPAFPLSAVGKLRAAHLKAAAEKTAEGVERHSAFLVVARFALFGRFRLSVLFGKRFAAGQIHPDDDMFLFVAVLFPVSRSFVRRQAVITVITVFAVHVIDGRILVVYVSIVVFVVVIFFVIVAIQTRHDFVEHGRKRQLAVFGCLRHLFLHLFYHLGIQPELLDHALEIGQPFCTLNKEA